MEGSRGHRARGGRQGGEMGRGQDRGRGRGGQQGDRRGGSRPARGDEAGEGVRDVARDGPRREEGRDEGRGRKKGGKEQGLGGVTKDLNPPPPQREPPNAASNAVRADAEPFTPTPPLPPSENLPNKNLPNTTEDRPDEPVAPGPQHTGPPLWELALERALLSQLYQGGGDVDAAAGNAEVGDRGEQLDELMALAAIFGVDLSGPAAAVASAALEGESPGEGDEVLVGGLLRFDLNVKMSDAAAEEGPPIRVFAGGGHGPTAVVTSLPPIVLSVIFPADYPSVRAPHFALSASWLSRSQLDAAAAELEQQWDEAPGDVVVFRWVSWLQEQAVTELWCPEGNLCLHPPAACGWSGHFTLIEARDGDGDEDEDGGILPSLEVSSGAPSRGVPICSGAEEAVMSLLRHDAVECAKRYATTEHTCGICFCDVLGRDMRQTSPGACTHRFCKDCLGEQARINVGEGTLAALTCPEPGCSSPLPPSLLRDLLPKEQFARWERLTLERSLDAMTDLVYCPRCEAAVIEDEGEDNCGQCTSCMFVFCTLCHAGWHPGSTCLTPERRLEVLRARASGNAQMGEDARRKHREQLADAMAQRYIEREGKQCPKCGTGVVKSEGCNKMMCGNCSCYFCFRCGKQIKGYEHFREGNCTLFDLRDIEAWEHQMNMNPGQMMAEQREHDAYIAGQVVQRTTCPACRQPNYKIGNNNHILCWSCNQHFCYACRARVRRGAETAAHYGPGPGKCRQHSAD